MTWLAYALMSALAAAFTAILSKLGVAGVPSNVATAVRTLVVGAAAWAIVAASGELRTVRTLPSRSIAFLLLSGVATAVSWLAYFKALQMAPASWVAPIDKLSLPLTVVLAVWWLGEPFSGTVAAGVALMVVGAIVTRL